MELPLLRGPALEPQLRAPAASRRSRRAAGCTARSHRLLGPAWAVPRLAAAASLLVGAAGALRAEDMQSIDGVAFLQTRLETSTDSQVEEEQRSMLSKLFSRVQGSLRHPFFHPSREADITVQGQLDSNAIPYKSVAGLSDELDIKDMMQKGRRQRSQERSADGAVQLSRQQAPSVDSEPKPIEVPRMPLTDYKSYRQAMVNFGDVQYISYITIGRQTISGILDTGSFELVVFSGVCESCGQAAKYDATLSSTYTAGKLASGQSYGSGETTSLEAFDQVAIGPFDESNQTFWEVFDAHMPILYHAAFQSIIGVGPPETPAADAWSHARKAAENITEFYEMGKVSPSDARQRLSNKITIAKEMSSKSTMLDTFRVSMFSVCVGARPGSDGYFIWNDTSAVDDPTMFWQVPVVGKHTWSVQIQKVRLEHTGQDFTNGQAGQQLLTGEDKTPLGCFEDGCGALVDSGTSLLAVPTAVINKLLMYLENMGANCSKLTHLPDLAFEMNGMRFSLPPDAYVAEVKGNMPNYLANFVRVRNLHRANGQCQLVLMESFADSMFGPLWILGVPFFRKYYTTFSVGKTKKDRSIHVASASEDCTPVQLHTGSPSLPYKRCIDPAKLYVPATVMAAATEEFVHL